jgi:hypothetical protein
MPYSDLIIPAVKGTTSILNSALKHGSTVKRFVLTSSSVAILEGTAVPRFFTESNWNNAAVEAVKTQGAAAGAFALYMASKTLAEKAAWEFVAEHKSEISWDLVAINPAYIFGVRFSSVSGAPPNADGSAHLYSPHSALHRRSMISIPLSAKSMIPSLGHGRVRNYVIRQPGCMWPSSLRRMCALHMQLLLVASGSSSDPDPTSTRTSVSLIFIPVLSCIQETDVTRITSVDAAAELGIPNVPRGEPGSTKDIQFLFNFQTTKAEELLGLTQVTPLKDMVAESVEDFKARGYPGFTA